MSNPYFLRDSPTETCPRCLFTDDIAEIKGEQCEYCNIHDRLEREAKYDWQKALKKIRTNNKYDCLIGISGGLDSSTLLYAAVKVWKLKVLCVHFDNHANTKEAEHNMLQLVQKLNVDFIRYSVNKEEYDNINKALLEAGVADADATNDCAMAKLMLVAADQYKIKTTLNGHCFRSEGSTPAQWSKIDPIYLESVYSKYNYGKKLINYPILTVWDQVKYGFKGIKQVRPFHNQEVFNMRDTWEKEMKQLIGFKSYGGKHAENIYTNFIGSFVLPRKFNIDKRIVYLSARVRSGLISRDAAQVELSTPSPFDLSLIEPEILSQISTTINSRDEYKKYDYKKYKWLIWLLCKIRIMPMTVYLKYCR